MPTDFLYTNIGRGHPFYLDGIREMLSSRSIGSVTDVFECSRGLSRIAWRLARALYTRGSSGGGRSSLYSRIRRHTDYSRRSPMLRLMARDIRRRFIDDEAPLVVAHPSLIGMLNGKFRLVYQHGEMVAPAECVLPGLYWILVPHEGLRPTFSSATVRWAHVIVTGLCIEPSLVARATSAWGARQERLNTRDRLTVAFFSSGAEPSGHVRTLVTAAASAAQAGHAAVLFARRGGAFARATKRLASPHGVELRPYSSRDELNRLTATIFPKLDCFVAPPHERTHWALGLGLPMFIVDPPIGTFAPLNRELLLNEGVADRIAGSSEARDFGRRLNGQLGNGELAARALRGWGRYEIDGFAKCAEFLRKKWD